jgi:integrase
MASIKKRGTRWFARYRDNTGHEHGQRFDRKTDAQHWLDQQTAALVTGQYVDPRAGRITLRTYGEKWQETAPHGPTTRDLVARSLERHIYPVLGDLPMSAIRFTQVQALVTSMGIILAPSTVRVKYSYLVSIMNAAVLDKVITSSPCGGVRLPEVRKKEVQIPPLAVLDAVRETLPERFRAVVDLVAGSGLRQGEVFGLEVDGLDFQRTRSVDVHQQLITLANQAPYLDEPKTAESERVVPLAQVTLDALAKHLAVHPAHTVTVTDRTDPRKPVEREARLVFTLDDGTPVARHTWSGIWAPAAKAAGLPARTGLHVLRHLYASLLIRHGESVKTVQKRLGHSSAAITLDTYGHLWLDADDTTRAAVQDALAKSIDTADNSRTGEGS